MRIIIRLIGKGTPEDPYRVPLPTYRIIKVDYRTLIAEVEVPDWYFEEEYVDPKTGKVKIRKLDKINIKKLLKVYRRSKFKEVYEKHKHIIENLRIA